MNLKQKQQEVDEYYAHMGHTHIGSLDWINCPSCNPSIKPNIIAYVYDCIKCNEQFVTKKYRKKKKRLCKNCK